MPPSVRSLPRSSWVSPACLLLAFQSRNLAYKLLTLPTHIGQLSSPLPMLHQVCRVHPDAALEHH